MLIFSTRGWRWIFAGIAVILHGCAVPAANTGTNETLAPRIANFNPAAAGLKIAVSIPPQKYWLEKIVGEHAQVVSLTNSYDDVTDPNFHPENAAVLESANLYVKIGLPFERKLAVPSSCKTVSMMKDLKFKTISSHVNKLNPDDKFPGADYYIWLAPSRVVRMLVTAYEQVRDLDPENGDEYNANFTRLTRDLNSLEGDIGRILIDRLSDDILVFKPTLGYFCEDFGLKQHSADLTDSNSAELVRAAIAQKIRVILLTAGVANLDQRTPQLLSGTAATINPLMENYPENLRNIARAIAGRSPSAD